MSEGMVGVHMVYTGNTTRSQWHCPLFFASGSVSLNAIEEWKDCNYVDSLEFHLYQLAHEA
jgi:hypothetical protein